MDISSLMSITESSPPKHLFSTCLLAPPEGSHDSTVSLDLALDGTVDCSSCMTFILSGQNLHGSSLAWEKFCRVPVGMKSNILNMRK